MAKSHIFPRAFAHDMRAGAAKLYIASKNADRYEFSQSGPSDGNFLCISCEAKLSDCDDYAVRWIRAFDSKATDCFKGLAKAVPNPKPDLLVKFASAVLWRAATAPKTASPDIDLGPWDFQLRQYLFGNSDYRPSVCILQLRWTVGGNYVGDITVQPYRALLRGRRTYLFDLAGFRFLIRLNNRGNAPEFSHQFRANGQNPLLVLDLGFREISEDSGFMSIFTEIETALRDT